MIDMASGPIPCQMTVALVRDQNESKVPSLGMSEETASQSNEMATHELQPKPTDTNNTKDDETTDQNDSKEQNTFENNDSWTTKNGYTKTSDNTERDLKDETENPEGGSSSKNNLNKQAAKSTKSSDNESVEADNEYDNVSQFICPICNVLLNSQHEFTLHIRSHNNNNSESPTNHTSVGDDECILAGGKGYVCCICGKILSSSSSLDRHVLVHSGERPFKCSICRVSFTTNGNMHRHMRTHNAGSNKGMTNSIKVNGSNPLESSYESDCGSDSSGTSSLSPCSKRRKTSNNSFHGSSKNMTHSASNQSRDLKPNVEIELNPVSIPTGNKRKNSDLNSTLDDSGSKEVRLCSNTVVRNNFPVTTTASNPRRRSSKTSSSSDGEDHRILNKFKCPVCKREDFSSLNLLETHLEAKHPEFKACCEPCNLVFKNHRALNLHRFMKHPDHERQSNGGDIVGFDDLTFVDFSSEKFPYIAKTVCEKSLHKACSRQLKFQCERCQRAFPLASALTIHRQSCSQAAKEKVECALENEIKYRKSHHKAKRNMMNTDASSEDESPEVCTPYSKISSYNHHTEISEDSEESDEQRRDSFFARLDLRNKITPNSLSPLSGPEELMNNAIINQCLQPTQTSHTNNKFDNTAQNITRNLKSLSGSNMSVISEVRDLADIQSIISVTSAGNTMLPDLSKSPQPSTTITDVTPPDSASREEEEQQDCFAAEFRKMKLRGEFPCRLCTAIFPNLRALKGHNRVHLVAPNSGANLPYRCNMCPHFSNDKSALIRHMRTHNGDRPYECSICHYAFTTKANCERHLRNRHAKMTREDVKKSIIYHPSEDPTNDVNGTNLMAFNCNDIKRTLFTDHLKENIVLSNESAPIDLDKETIEKISATSTNLKNSIPMVTTQTLEVVKSNKKPQNNITSNLMKSRLLSAPNVGLEFEQNDHTTKEEYQNEDSIVNLQRDTHNERRKSLDVATMTSEEDVNNDEDDDENEIDEITDLNNENEDKPLDLSMDALDLSRKRQDFMKHDSLESRKSDFRGFGMSEDDASSTDFDKYQEDVPQDLSKKKVIKDANDFEQDDHNDCEEEVMVDVTGDEEKEKDLTPKPINVSSLKVDESRRLHSALENSELLNFPKLNLSQFYAAAAATGNIGTTLPSTFFLNNNNTSSNNNNNVFTPFAGSPNPAAAAALFSPYYLTPHPGVMFPRNMTQDYMLEMKERLHKDLLRGLQLSSGGSLILDQIAMATAADHIQTLHNQALMEYNRRLEGSVPLNLIDALNQNFVGKLSDVNENNNNNYSKSNPIQQPVVNPHGTPSTSPLLRNVTSPNTSSSPMSLVDKDVPKFTIGFSLTQKNVLASGMNSTVVPSPHAPSSTNNSNISSDSISPSSASSVKMVIKNGVLIPKQKQRRYRTERPFSCEHCSARFTLRSNMERHIKQQHPQFWTQRQRSGHGAGRRAQSRNNLQPTGSLNSQLSYFPHLAVASGSDNETSLPSSPREDPIKETSVLMDVGRTISDEVKHAIALQLKSKNPTIQEGKDAIMKRDEKVANYLKTTNEIEEDENVFDAEEENSERLVIDEERIITDTDNEDKEEAEARNEGNTQAAVPKYLSTVKKETRKIPFQKDESLNVDLASVSRLLDNASTQTFKEYFHNDDDQMRDENSEEDEEGLVAANSEGNNSGSDENKSESDTAGSSMGNRQGEKKKSAYSLAPNRVSCPYCSRKFPWSSSLRRHVLTHTGQKPFKCSHCSLLFTTKSNCDRHLLRKHGNNNNSNTNNNNSVNNNCNNDAGDDAIQGRIVENASNSQIEGAIDSYDAFKNSQHLNSLSYTMRNVPERPYKCKYCPSSTFSTLSNLRKHISSKHPNSNIPVPRGGAKRSSYDGYESPQSSAEDAESDVAVAEIKSSQEAPNQCDKIKMSMENFPKVSLSAEPTSSSRLPIPILNPGATETTVSGGSILPQPSSDLPFKCHLCDSSFGERQEALDHIRDAHESEYTLLAMKGALDSGTADEATNQDDPNGEESLEQLRGKFPDYANRKVMCAFCLRRFWSAEDLRRHMRTHTGERPFSCDICRRRFTLKHSMLRHRKKHSLQRTAVGCRSPMQANEASDDETNINNNNNLPLTPTGKAGNEEFDLISNLLGIGDKSIVDEMIRTKSAEDAAKLLGVLKH